MTNIELDPTLKKILSQPGNPDSIPVEEQHPNEAREEFNSDIAAVDAPAPHVETISEVSIPGSSGSLPARIYTPGTVKNDGPLLVYFHGGGNIRGNIDTHDSTCRVLSTSAPCVVLSVDYRLAPEDPFPAATDDALNATRWAHVNAKSLNCSPDKLIVGGDSAGGNLAAVTAIRARDEAGPPIAAQLLIYPVIDHLGETESKKLYSSGYLLDSMPFYTKCYLPDETQRANPHASPIYAESLANLPPSFVLTAGYDPLHDEGYNYAKRLKSEGVYVEHINYPSMIHGFTLLRSLLPDADQALSQCARSIVKMIDL